MGLKKKIKLASGFEASYWRIRTILMTDEKTSIVAELYKDKKSRNEKLSPILEEVIEIESSKSPLSANKYKTIGDNPFKLAYQYLKTIDDFKNSEDS